MRLVRGKGPAITAIAGSALLTLALLDPWVIPAAPDGPAKVEAGRMRQAGLTIEEGKAFWSYRPPAKAAVPHVRNEAWPRSEVDRFILAELEKHGLQPGPDADRGTLARRVYFDLIGLPPTPEEQDAFLEDESSEALASMVDRLLASPRFGERWGRHWLDVVRFGESVTLRGLVFKEAWRYRDYVIGAFNQDMPFDQFIREQMAGDLLPATTLSDRQRLLVATTFWTLGNSNLEEQDKKQLEMDVVDEQLDVVGKGLLAQTITCARCHDHKFDPIPTRDYYALAGILKGATMLAHANVSGWVEVPLPVSEAEEAAHRAHEQALAGLEDEIKSAKELLAKLKEPAKDATAGRPAILGPGAFSGIVVDSAEAKLVGEWKHSQYSKRYIGDGYLHDLDTGKGVKTLTFLPVLPREGRYEVRFAYIADKNRAPNVPVTIFSADGEFTVRVNEQEPPPIEGRFVSLGQFKFELNGQGFVLVGNEGARGYVTADAVQFLPLDPEAAPAAPAAPDLSPLQTSEQPVQDADQARQATHKIKLLESQLKDLKAAGPRRPMAMSLKEDKPGPIPVHMRGSVHSLGDIVPRGFLSVASAGEPPELPADQSGRLQLADWLASPRNPLTARVLVNRVWHWLFGAGLVRTVDNFGTTGEEPSHPRLLDHLALRFMEQGWSVKRLIRELMLSRVYQLSSANPATHATNHWLQDSFKAKPGFEGQDADPPAMGDQNSKIPFSAPQAGRGRAVENQQSTINNQQSNGDPENRLLGRMHRRRLDAECMRDALLAISGQLDLTMGGPTVASGLSADYGQAYEEPRRSVYVPVYRNALPELFEVFDFADPSMVTGQRNTSTVTPQALFFMNHPFAREQARAAARRLLSQYPEPDHLAEGIIQAYRLVLGRHPTQREKVVAKRFLQPDSSDAPSHPGGKDREEAWTEFFQALFGSVEFRYVH